VRPSPCLPGLDGGRVQVGGEHAQHGVKVRQIIVYTGHLAFGFQQPSGNFAMFADQGGDDMSLLQKSGYG
jgi:hypothetical protein